MNAYPRKTTAQIDNIPINFISLSDLKQNKIAAGRHKDLDDVNAIIKVEKALAKQATGKKK